MSEFKCGDLVRLKSGGPAMTVGQIVTAEMVEKDKEENDGETILEEGNATCAWFIELCWTDDKGASRWGEARSGDFHVDMLVKA